MPDGISDFIDLHKEKLIRDLEIENIRQIALALQRSPPSVSILLQANREAQERFSRVAGGGEKSQEPISVESVESVKEAFSQEHKRRLSK